MTKWLIRRFVADREQVAKPAVRTAYGRLATTTGLLCNLLLAMGKLLVGLLSGSVSVIADAANNLSDASSSVISLLGFKMASKPADPEHPYGHARYEYLAGLMVCVIILLIGVELFRSSLNKVINPSPVQFSWITVGVLAASILVKQWMASFYRRIGSTISSNTLQAAATDSRNDVISTSIVLIAALISHFFKMELDGWMGLAVACFILYSGFGLLRETLDPLLGNAPDPELVQQIRDLILYYPGVLGTHDLMLHDYGPGRRFGSVHVEMAAEDDIMQSHDVIDGIERDILQQMNIHLIIHLDPIVTQDPLVADLRLWLSEQVKQIHPELTIHDVRLVKGITHSNLIFDCVKPSGLDMADDALKRALSEVVRQKHPSYFSVITIDESYATVPQGDGAKSKEH
ncbi:MAG: cation transporter [Clostridiales bacterium]|nr:cation transporter [Clostridiales bacterium]